MRVDRKILARYTARETLGVAVMAAALFWPAGTLNWWQAWALLAVVALWVLAIAITALRTSPDLLVERLGPRKGSRRWDTLIVSILGLLQLARLVIAGLDRRNEWTANIPLAWQIGGLLVCLAGHALFIWALASNRFFSQIVRIQAERGHVAATGGPYRYLRHPGYLGAIFFELGAPVLLASWPALLVSLLSVALLVLRTALEDRLLQKELPGYQEYARRVDSRLLPGVW